MRRGDVGCCASASAVETERRDEGGQCNETAREIAPRSPDHLVGAQ